MHSEVLVAPIITMHPAAQTAAAASMDGAVEPRHTAISTRKTRIPMVTTFV